MELTALKERIIDECASIKLFAKLVKMDPRTITDKLNGKKRFTLRDIDKMVPALRVTASEVCPMFFPNEPKSENKKEKTCKELPLPEFDKQLTPAELYLIYRVRIDPKNAETACSLMGIPFTEHELQENKEWSVNGCRSHAEYQKYSLIDYYRRNKIQRNEEELSKTIDEICQERIKHSEDYWNNLQSKRIADMQRFLNMYYPD